MPLLSTTSATSHQSYPLSDLRQRKQPTEPSTSASNDEDATSTPSTALIPWRTFHLTRTALTGSHRLRVLALPTGGAARTSSPVYHTSRLFWPHGFYQPPHFTVSHGAVASPSAPLVARVRQKSWEGLVGLHFAIELHRPSPSSSSSEESPLLRTVHVRRTGVGRAYRVAAVHDGASAEAQRLCPAGFLRGLDVRGTARRELRRLDVRSEDGTPTAFDTRGGHLKVTAAGHVLAVWENDTALYRLGNLLVFAGEEGWGREEGCGLEEVVLVVMGIVFAERTSTRGWWSALKG